MAIIRDSGSHGPQLDLATTSANATTQPARITDIYAPLVDVYGNVNDSFFKLLDGIVKPPSSGGGKGGGGGGGGYDYTDPNVGSRVRDDLIFWFGEAWVQANPGVVAYHLERKSTVDDVRRYAVDNGANGYGMVQIRNVLSQTLAGLLGGAASSALPDSLFRTLIRTGAYENAATLQTSLSGLQGIDWDKAFDPTTGAPVLEPFFDKWEDMTGGANFGTRARETLQSIVNQYGYGDEAFAAWSKWVETTDSAKNGNWGADRRASITSLITSVLKRAPTAEELATTGDFWNMSDALILEKIRATTEYAALYPGKPPGMSEAQYMAEKDSWDWAYQQAYGIDVAALSGMPGTSGEFKPTDTGAAALIAKGVQQWGQGSDGRYFVKVGGTTLFFPDLATAMAMAEQYGIDVTGGPQSVPGAPTDLMLWGIANGISADEWAQSIQWQQQAIVAEGTYDPILMEALGIDLSSDDWYKYTSKAVGWGDIQLKIMEAQNKMEYREVFRNYTGHDPSPADYEAVTTQFISPSEYAHRMAAKESATAMLPQANELLNRIYGNGTTLSELENLAMNGQGSGALRAKLDQAARLDQYRWTHKQKYGTEPTPADYARYAGYAGPAELEWELNLAESISEFGPDVQETWKKIYNEDISEESLRIMFGNMKGSGELKYKYKKAKEQESELEQAHEAGFTTPGAMNLYSAAKQGGFKESMAGLADMN